MKHTAAENMILGQIITNEVLDPRILQAMKDTPREEFVPPQLRGAAYVDEDLDVGGGRELMAPLTFAKLVHLAEIVPASRVLNIGCLAGYTAAVLARLAAHIVATETDAAQVEQAKAHMARLNLSNVSVQQVKSLADGYAGSAPYDVIVISGAIQFLPEAVGQQIAKDGRLVAVQNVASRPGFPGGLGKGLFIRRIGNQLQSREHFDAGAALLPGFENPQAFRF